MKELFCSYKSSIELKKLGFNEECFGYFNPEFNLFEYFDLERGNSNLQSDYGGTNKICTAPLHQQAIKFLIEKLDFFYPLIQFRIFSDESGCWHYVGDIYSEEYNKLEILFDGLEEAISLAIELYKHHKE